jgi:hypothetical protein
LLLGRVLVLNLSGAVEPQCAPQATRELIKGGLEGSGI